MKYRKFYFHIWNIHMFSSVKCIFIYEICIYIFIYEIQKILFLCMTHTHIFIWEIWKILCSYMKHAPIVSYMKYKNLIFICLGMVSLFFCFLGFVELLRLWVCIFHQIWKKFRNYLLKFFFSPTVFFLFFWNTNDVNVDFPIVSQIPETVSFFWSNFSLLFRLGE